MNKIGWYENVSLLCLVQMVKTLCFRHSCECESGFMPYQDPELEDGGLRCVDVNECEVGSHTCQEDSGCVNTEGGFECVCQGEECSKGKNTRLKFELVSDITPSGVKLVQFWPRHIFVAVELLQVLTSVAIISQDME